MFYVACNVPNVEAYASECRVSKCNTGWRASEDGSECLANKCSCRNGIKATGEKCLTDGAQICESCDIGFKLSDDDNTFACTGKQWLAKRILVDPYSLNLHLGILLSLGKCIVCRSLLVFGHSASRPLLVFCAYCISLCVSLSACNVANAKAYSSGCVLSSCNTGWKVSDDKSKCVANTCSCPKGTAAVGAKCVSDGATICESCNAGFKFDNTNEACAGPLAVYCRCQWPFCLCVQCLSNDFTNASCYLSLG